MKRVISRVLACLGVAVALFSCQKAPVLEFTGPTSFSFTRDVGSERVTFTTNRDWTVSSTQSWCKVSPSSGSGSDTPITVTLTCEANSTYDARSATLTIKADELTQSLSVSQETGLGLVVSPKTIEVSNAAQTIEIEVQKNVEYNFSIDPDAREWITYTGTKGLTSEKLTFSIAANETYDDREGVIAFKQDGGPLFESVVIKQSQTDGMFITQPEYNLSDEGHTLSVEVNSNVTFSVTPEVGWIHYVETKALKSSTITLTVDANDTYDARTGKVTVKQTNGTLTGEIIVNQAVNYGILVDPEEISISKDAQTVEVEVRHNVEYEIVIPDAAKDWVSIAGTKGLSSQVVTFSIAENTKYLDRETAIAFKQKGGDLTGTVKIVQAQTDYLSSSPKKDSLSYKGGTVNLTVVTNIDYSLAIAEGEEWITIGEMADKGTHEGLTTFEHAISAPENEITAPRYAVINVLSATGETLKTFTIAQGPQPIVEFADATFKAICIEKYDVDGDGELTAAEAAQITELSLYNKEITSVKGIEFMPNLAVLDCGKNLLTSLDVTHNPALTKLDCYNNNVKKLDVSKNTLLKELSCYNSGLATLDLSHNTALEKLSCGKNQLVTLDVSYCPALNFLSCGENPFLKEIWLAKDQTIENLTYDESVAQIKHKN